MNSTMELVNKLKVEHSITLAYSHEENGSVDRANREVLRRLRDLVFDTRLINVWSDMLPVVQRLQKFKTIERVGFSPAQIIFGNAIDMTFISFRFESENRSSTLPAVIMPCA